MSPRWRRSAWLTAAAALVLGACTANSDQPDDSGDSAVSQEADNAIAAMRGKVLSTGPHGEKAATADAVALTEAEVAKVKALKATAAIVMHYGGNDWAAAQFAGLEKEFGELGIEVVAKTDANGKPDKQISDLETVMAKKPDIIVSIPMDPVATASAYKKAAAAGIKLVFMDNVPQGMIAGRDYVSAVSADNYGNGVVSAHLLAKALGGKGKVGVIYFEADFFVTNQRRDGFTKTIKEKYEDIEIVKSRGFAGPDFAGNAQAVANAMLSQEPDLAAIWAVWDVPAEGVIAAAQGLGRDNLKIVTEDLGKPVAIRLAKKQFVVGLGAQRPFDQGETEARVAANALLGKRQPPFIALSPLAVDHGNVLEAWEEVYHAPAPQELVKDYKRDK